MRNYIIGLCSLIGILFLIAFITRTPVDPPPPPPVDSTSVGILSSDTSEDTTWPSDLEIPLTNKSLPEQILVREGFTISYNKSTKCANWVAWHYTRDKDNGEFKRQLYYDENGNIIGIGPVTPEICRNSYIVDLEVPKPRQELNDYYDSKYENLSHGHLCPAADCKWSKKAMNQSFLLTNMCPQNEQLNGGDWEGLEKRCRGWARNYGDIYIVCGPIFYEPIKTMGDNCVGVPNEFFKVVLCLNKSPKALGFIFPNEGTHHNLEYYIRTVDEVENNTGFDFFHNLPDDIEDNVEKTSNLKVW